MKYKNLLRSATLLATYFFLMSYISNPPDGRTGAPFDGHCNNCHTSNNPGGFNGVAVIHGLPDTIVPNTTYQLQLIATPTAGNPLKAGFQLVIVDKDNNNAGHITPANIEEADVDVYEGREYFDQRVPKFFNGTPVTWNFQWTAPNTALCNIIHFYYIVNYCNGGGDFGDYAIPSHLTRHFGTGISLSSNASTLLNVDCPAATNGSAIVQTLGGQQPYQYIWSNGATTATNTALTIGTYAVTVTDAATCTSTSSVTVVAQDTLSPLIQCPANLYACAGDTIYFAAPIATDNCPVGLGQPELLSGLPSGSVFPVGQNSQIYQVRDSFGNTENCTFMVQIWSKPSIVLDTTFNDSNNAGIGSIALTVNEGTPPFKYIWKKDGNLLAATTEDLNGLSSGQYEVAVMDDKGCIALSGPIVITNTVATAFSQSVEQGYRIVPNPVQDHFWVKSSGAAPIALQLIGPDGKESASFTGAAASGILHINELPSGLYRLKIQTATGAFVVLPFLKL